MAQIHIQGLRLRTIIGVFDWERTTPQDIVINITLDFDSTQAAKTDDIASTVDYKAITKKIILLANGSSFHLIETLAQRILELTLDSKQVIGSSVKIDKPGALRYAKSVAITVHGTNKQ